MRLFTRFIILWFALLGGGLLSAQDVHFSMFYASPLNLNPALTGVNDGSYRIAGIYRNQWRSVSTPFVTYSGSFDIKLLENKLKKNIFGVGAMFTGDRSGDGRLTMNSMMASASFHKNLDKDGKHYIGLGVQLGYTMKNVRYQQLTFPNQFLNTDFDLSVPNGENSGTNPKLGYFDMQAGLLHQSTIKDVLGIMSGITVYHLVPPKESFLGEQMKLPMRITAHLGFRIKAAKHFYINPNFIYQYQNKAQEMNFGASLEYRIPAKKTEAVVSLGGWYRLKDAAIVSMGVEYYKVRIMAAYDFNTSSLKPATGSRGGFEIALIYTGIIKSGAVNYPVLVPCPMM